MTAVGIVAEFNPFHNGHRYLIEKAKEITGADTVLAVMSGNFTQRGEPALFSKWKRAEAAVRSGVDLVLELPQIFAVSSADEFARGSIEILEQSGMADFLAFGSESGDIAELKRVSFFLNENKEEIRELGFHYRKISYPSSQERAVLELDPDFPVSVLREPNNLLGVKYLQNIRSMKPVTVLRSDHGYIESASAERRKWIEAHPDRFERVQERFFLVLKGILLRMKEEELLRIQGTQGGLGRKLFEEISGADSLEDLMAALKTKAYTRAHISRMIISVLLGIQLDEAKRTHVYIRPLALNQKGALLLRNAKKKDRMTAPFLGKLPRDLKRYPELQRVFEIDRLAQKYYSLFFEEDAYINDDFVCSPVLV
ncbi:MAG: nucleotidyltransferase family protein [Eubacteriales bacterium]|nr:nucleotidyltransferase family protein [Eubacteriales bacterium]